MSKLISASAAAKATKLARPIALKKLKKEMITAAARSIHLAVQRGFSTAHIPASDELAVNHHLLVQLRKLKYTTELLPNYNFRISW